MADQACGQIETALHATGVVLGLPVGSVCQVELRQQFDGARPRVRPAEVEQPADDLQVLPAGEFLLNRRRLPGQPDGAPYPGRALDNVTALDQGPAPVRYPSGGQ